MSPAVPMVRLAPPGAMKARPSSTPRSTSFGASPVLPVPSDSSSVSTAWLIESAKAEADGLCAELELLAVAREAQLVEAQLASLRPGPVELTTGLGSSADNQAEILELGAHHELTEHPLTRESVSRQSLPREPQSLRAAEPFSAAHFPDDLVERTLRLRLADAESARKTAEAEVARAGAEAQLLREQCLMLEGAREADRVSAWQSREEAMRLMQLLAEVNSTRTAALQQSVALQECEELLHQVSSQAQELRSLQEPDLAQQLKAKEREATEAKAEIRDLQAREEALQRNLHKKEAELKKAQSRSSVLQSELQGEKVRSLQHQLRSVESEKAPPVKGAHLEDERSAVVAARQEIKDLRAALSTESRRRADAEERFSKAVADTLRLQAEKSHHQDEEEKGKRQKEERERHQHALERDSRQLRNRLADMQKAKETAEAEVARLRSEVVGLRKDCRVLEEQRDAERATAQKCQSETQRSLKLLGEATTSKMTLVQSCEERLQQAQREVQELRAQVAQQKSELASALSAHEHISNTTKAEFGDLRGREEELRRHLYQQEAKLQQAGSQLQSNELRLQEEEEAKALVHHELREAQQVAAAAEAASETLALEAARAAAEVERSADERVAAAQAAKSSLESLSEQQQREIRQLQSKLKSLTDERDDWMARDWHVQDLEQQTRQFRKRVTALEAERNELQEQLHEERSQRMKTQAAIASAKGDRDEASAKEAASRGLHEELKERLRTAEAERGEVLQRFQLEQLKVQEMQTRLTLLEAEKHAALAASTGSTAELSRMAAEVSQLQSDLAQVRSERADLARARDDLQRLLEQSQEESREASLELTAAAEGTAVLDDLRGRVEGAEHQWQVLETSLASERRAVLQWQERARHLEELHNTSEAELLDLREKLKAARADSEVLRQEAAVHRKHADASMQAVIHEHQLQVADLQRQLSASLHDRDGLVSSVQALREQTQALHIQTDEAAAKHKRDLEKAQQGCAESLAEAAKWKESCGVARRELQWATRAMQDDRRQMARLNLELQIARKARDSALALQRALCDGARHGLGKVPRQERRDGSRTARRAAEDHQALEALLSSQSCPSKPAANVVVAMEATRDDTARFVMERRATQRSNMRSLLQAATPPDMESPGEGDLDGDPGRESEDTLMRFTGDEGEGETDREAAEAAMRITIHQEPIAEGALRRPKR